MTLPLDESAGEAHDQKMSEPPEIYAALSNVMRDVQSVGKDGYNQAQKFSFRGVDGVTNAVGPRLREHGVIVTPRVLDISYRDFNTSKGALMHECTVRVEYTFWASDGSSIVCSAPGESADSGDKSTAKAMSVAYRTALLQALCIPTHEPDPDESTYKRVERQKEQPPEPISKDQAELMATVTEKLDADQKAELNDWYKSHSLPKKENLTEAQADLVLDKMAKILDPPKLEAKFDRETGEFIGNLPVADGTEPF